MKTNGQTASERGRPPSEEAVLGFLAKRPEATAADVAAAAGIGRSTAAKMLARLERSGEARRSAGGKEGGRRLPDRWELTAERASQEESAASEPGAEDAEPASSGAGRLRPGELDGLVLDYLRKHSREPLGPSAVAKSLQRSSGAVANSLARLTRDERVRQVGERPRRYLVGSDSP